MDILNSIPLKKKMAANIFSGIKYHIKRIDSSGVYDKDYMKIKFSSDDDIPLNKILNFWTITVIIRCVFFKNGKYHPECYLDECLYEV